MGNIFQINKLVKNLVQTSDNQDVKAAVVLLLRIINHEIQILLVKRAEDPIDTWSGQTALPGGKLDPGDLDLKATAVRETFEETGINLLENCRFLGAMRPLRSIERAEMQVLPFVVLLEKDQTITLNEELTEYFWVSIREIDKNKIKSRIRYSEYTTYLIKNHVIWGLTYNILHDFLSFQEAIWRVTFH